MLLHVSLYSRHVFKRNALFRLQFPSALETRENKKETTAATPARGMKQSPSPRYVRSKEQKTMESSPGQRCSEKDVFSSHHPLGFPGCLMSLDVATRLPRSSLGDG